MTDKLKLTIYNAPDDEEPMVEDGIDYVSYVAPSTYGPPALIAPPRGKDAATAPRAKLGEVVRYINTGPHGPPMWDIERYDDGQPDE